MGGAAAAACVSRPEDPRVGADNLGARTPSPSSPCAAGGPGPGARCSVSPAPCLSAAGPRPAARGRMEPALLIFLLYVMIAHELLCGWMQYRRQSAGPRRAAAGPPPGPSSRVCQGAWRKSSQSVRTIRGGRDLRKSGRIVRKA